MWVGTGVDERDDRGRRPALRHSHREWRLQLAVPKVHVETRRQQPRQQNGVIVRPEHVQQGPSTAVAQLRGHARVEQLDRRTCAAVQHPHPQALTLAMQFLGQPANGCGPRLIYRETTAHRATERPHHPLALDLGIVMFGNPQPAGVLTDEMPVSAATNADRFFWCWLGTGRRRGRKQRVSYERMQLASGHPALPDQVQVGEPTDEL